MTSNGTWNGFSAFEVFGDHSPMGGFFLVVRIVPDSAALDAIIERRAGESTPLDPELAQAMVRAGLGLMQAGSASFVYANTDEICVLIKSDAVSSPGRSLRVHDDLVSRFSARVALLAGQELPVHASVYEFPDMSVVRRAFTSALESVEDSTPARCARRLGAQMRGRGEPFHPSMVDTLEDQMGLLEDKGVDMEALPSWWWRGVAARSSASASPVELFDDLPAGEQFGALVPE